MILTLPSKKFKNSYIEATREFIDDKSYPYNNFDNCDIDFLITNFDEFVSKFTRESAGEGLLEGMVPATMYWLVDNEEYIGRVSIRHVLNEKLMREGGHIGYAIRPSKRKMGYGCKILGLSLPKAKELGINKALVTCDETNEASKKIILANGGKLDNIITIHPDKPRKMRFWIDISAIDVT